MAYRLVVIGALLAAVVVSAAAARVVDVRATLTGEVLSEGLVRPGQIVRDGDAVVYVRTLVGPAVAARAPSDGTVLDVLVRPGEAIREKGAVVARLQPR